MKLIIDIPKDLYDMTRTPNNVNYIMRMAGFICSAIANGTPLDDVKAENKEEWIPVTERLPEVNQNVLATTKWGELTIAEKLDIGPDCWFIYEGNANAHTEDIVAWQPLPEPYQKGGE